MKLRPVAACLLAAGLTIGSVIDGGPSRSPIATERGTILRADFHVHAFPGDGLLPAWELAREASRRGIDVIAVTNHNQTLAASFPVPRSGDLPLVVPGQEITTPKFHLVAVGVRDTINWRPPLDGLIEAIHAQGGVAIAAHPRRSSWHVNPESSAGVDGLEAMHSLNIRDPHGGIELLEFYRAVRAKKPTLAAIGSSDFHAVAPVGRASTYVFVNEVSESGVLDAIRRGHTVATDANALVGPPELVDLVRDTGAANAPIERHRTWSHIAALLVLSALALSVCIK